MHKKQANNSDDDDDDVEDNRPSIVRRFVEFGGEQISLLTRNISDAIQAIVLPTFPSQITAIPLLRLYPHKLLLQNLLRSEICSELPRLKRIANEDSNALRTNFFRYKLVLLGDTELVGGRHFAQLLSLDRLKRTKLFLAQVDALLGNPPRTVTTNRMDAEFIEFFDFKSCYSARVAYSRVNYVEVGVEVVIKSKQKTMTFDDCSTIFFRRVLEDAHSLEKAEGVFCSSLCIISSFSPDAVAQKVHLATMKEQRQHVLSILKSAVVSEGSIYLEFYFPADAGSETDSEEGELVCMRRFYRLSFVDTLERTRSFSKYPVQALGVGLFRSLRDAQSFLKVFKSHLDAMRTMSRTAMEQGAVTKGVAEGDVLFSGTAADSAASWMTWTPEVLRSFIDLMREEIQFHIRQGDLLAAAEKMMQLNSLLIEQENKTGPANRDPTSSISMEQLKCIALSEAVHLRAAREAVETLLSCQEIFLVSVSQSFALQKKQKGLLISEDERMDIVKLDSLFGLLAPAVVLIKRRILALNNLMSFSEFHYMYPYILSVMWKLFEPTMMVRPLQATEFFRTAKVGLYAVRNTILQSQLHLRELQGALNMLEVSICTEILMTMLNDDAVHMDSLRLQTEAIPGRFPRCMSDLLGIVVNPSTDSLDTVDGKSQKLLQNTQYFPISVSLQFMQKKPNSAEAVAVVTTTVPVSGELWEIYSKLGEYDWVRLGGVDYRVGIKNELAAYDVPQCVSEEGFRIRYLTETLVLQAVQEAFIGTTLSPSIIPHTSKTNTSLFRYASVFQLLLLFPNTRIQTSLFYPARNNLLLPCFSASKASKYSNNESLSFKDNQMGSRDLGYVEVADEDDGQEEEEQSAFPYRLVGSSFRKGRFHFKKKSIRLGGGVIGVDRVLSALGRGGFDTLFCDAWMIPPLFLSSPLSPAIAAAIPSVTDRHQMRVKIVSGLAVHSTLKKASKMEKISALADSDDGAIHYDGVPDIEVLVKVDYDYNIAGNKARNVFAVIVRACCEYMIRHSQHDWKLHSVAIPSKVESDGTMKDTKVFPFGDLCDEDKHPRLLFKMADRAASAGTAVIEASAAMLAQGNRPNLDELLEIFKSTVVGSEEDEDADVAKRGGRKVEVQIGGEDDYDSEDEEDTLDPCHTDMDRICRTSGVAQKLRQWMGNKTRVFVPCRIRFSLLAQQSIGKWKSALPNASANAVQSAVALSTGSDDMVARLVAGTVWFAHDASVILRDLMERSQLLWSRRKISSQQRNGAEAYFILLEAQNRHKAFQRCVSSSENAEAIHHAWVYALLTQNYSLATSIGRLGLGSVAFKLEQVLHYIASLERILESCNTQSLSSEEMHILAFTASFISQALRYQFGSPQMVHLRGGCCHVLQCADLLDKALGLACDTNDEIFEDELPNNYKGGEEERFPLSKKNVMKVQQPGIALSDSKNSVDLPPRLPSLNARKALASPASIAAVTSLLHRLQTLLKPLIFALVKDCLSGFPDIELSLRSDQVVMVDALKVAPIVLGHNCGLAAIHSFYRRARSTTNHLLASRSFLAMLRDKFEHIKAVSHHTTDSAELFFQQPAPAESASMMGPTQSSSPQSQPSENLAAANLISTLSATLSTQRKQHQEEEEEEMKEGIDMKAALVDTAAAAAGAGGGGGGVDPAGEDVKGEKAAPQSNGRARRRWQQLELESIEEQETRENSEHIAFPMPTQPRSLPTKSPHSDMSPNVLTASKASISGLKSFDPTHPAVRGSIATKFRSQSMLNNLRAYGGVAMNLRSAYGDVSSNQSSSLIVGHNDYDNEDNDNDDDDSEERSDQEEDDEEVDEGQDEGNSMLFTLRNMKTTT